MTLISKNKMGFITGSIHVPNTQCPLYPSWERCNNLIISWLLNFVHLFWLRYWYLEWSSRTVFSRWSAELQEEIYDLQQGSQNVTDYFTNLKTVWKELDNYCPLSSCNCSARTYHQQDFIIRFLKELDERFSVVRSQILLMDPLSSITKVFFMLI